MEIEGVRVALGLVCAKQPSFALGILAKKEGGGPQQPRPASSTASRLCICTYCRKNPMNVENCALVRPNQIATQGFHQV